MKNISIYLIVIAGILLFSCESYLDPIDQKPITEDILVENPTYIEGLLLEAYAGIMDDYNYFLDAATDDAVTNDRSSNFYAFANGAVSSEFFPTDWYTAYDRILHLNKFLEVYDNIPWYERPDSSDEANKARSDMFKKRVRAEAYGLRAYWELKLLQQSSGKVSDTEILGFPIVTEVLTSDNDVNVPRASFNDCVAQIISDCDEALKDLPDFYNDDSTEIYTLAFGSQYTDRLNGLAVKAIKAQTYLLAASPAFNVGGANDAYWADAAEAAASVLEVINFTRSDDALDFYNIVSNSAHNDDVIWALSRRNRRDFEEDNFPPSKFGNGRINPSQNLVDAFADASGYPITHTSSTYDADNPYVGRDNRFDLFILRNEGTSGEDSIFTYVGADSDGLDEQQASTRTGYYVNKLLNFEVSLTPGAAQSRQRAVVLFRFTEMFLAYAEAANEAWGPDSDPQNLGLTATDAISEIRKLAFATDNYLSTVTSQDAFRTLVQNERRIELCFEGSRFWDIRRWGLLDVMKETVNGMSITRTGNSYTYNVVPVEERPFADYMQYGPIPYDDVINGNLQQNLGW